MELEGIHKAESEGLNDGKRNRILIVALPLMIILLGFIVYDYGYLKIRTELNSIKEREALRTKT